MFQHYLKSLLNVLYLHKGDLSTVHLFFKEFIHKVVILWGIKVPTKPKRPCLYFLFLNTNYILSSLFNVYSNCCWSLFANEVTYHHLLAMSHVKKSLQLIQLLFSSTIWIICNNQLICGLLASKATLLSSRLGIEQEGKGKETQLYSTRAALKSERTFV